MEEIIIAIVVLILLYYYFIIRGETKCIIKHPKCEGLQCIKHNDIGGGEFYSINKTNNLANI